MPVAGRLARQGRRIGLIALGSLLCVAGVALLFLPGPGLLVVVAGLAVLARELPWARRLLERARAKLARGQQGGARGGS